MRHGLAASMFIWCLANIANGFPLLSLQDGDNITWHADGAGDSRMIANLPSSNSGSAIGGTYSKVRVDYSLVDSSFAVNFSQTLSGAAGSGTVIHVYLGYSPNADLHYEITGNLDVTGKLWTGSPPVIDLQANYAQRTSFDGSSLTLPAISGTVLAGAQGQFVVDTYLQGTTAGSGAEASGGVTMNLSLLGDLNGDRRVGFYDLVKLAADWGSQRASYSEGDLNNDGNVGFDDLVALAAHYGEDFSGGAVPVNVPEPTCFVTVASLWVMLLRREREVVCRI